MLFSLEKHSFGILQVLSRRIGWMAVSVRAQKNGRFIQPQRWEPVLNGCQRIFWMRSGPRCVFMPDIAWDACEKTWLSAGKKFKTDPIPNKRKNNVRIEGTLSRYFFCHGAPIFFVKFHDYFFGGCPFMCLAGG